MSSVPHSAALVEHTPQDRARAYTKANGSVVLGSMMLLVLIVLGLITVSGFGTGQNVRAMLLFASFLGIAAVGQTLCALVGGLDVSIPYVIGAANIVMLWLVGKGFGSVAAILTVLVLAGMVGTVNGLASYRRPAQSLVVSLATGFTVLGVAQFVTSSQDQAGGTLAGTVPPWLERFATLQGKTLGLPIAPAVVLWVIIAALILFGLRASWLGRGIYAVGGSRVAAHLAGIPEPLIWGLVFAASALTAAITGILLLGYGGGGYADVGQEYLFSTVAAVIIGGTTLNGGRGGYGLTILGVAILTVLTTVLIGLGLSAAAQQTALGLLIVPMVAIYARGAHPSTQL
jgi:ribose transport system permease protein